MREATCRELRNTDNNFGGRFDDDAAETAESWPSMPAEKPVALPFPEFLFDGP
ncbi:hypothetical protein K0M31_005186 [Melipona bicolor]|uniref:Uncharacterized protein n=1 Tax=Melipona bicolor TaxID=60889 RepID=A0AA40KM82_9HYME|nr:hypothetical protein K0M31_005186 [Melipona bicolor]